MAEEYPRNLTELETNFRTDEACRAYLARLRWPAGFRCPRCGSGKEWRVGGLGGGGGGGMPAFGGRRNNPPRYADSLTAMVSRHVVDDDAEEWRQRVGAAAG